MYILNHLRKPYFALFLASLILFVSCEQYDNDIPINNSVESSVKFSGQELFSSIIFMDGKATSLFPVIEDNFNIKEYLNNPEKKEEYKEMQQRAIEFIQIENPDFFNNFQRSMYSKNPIVIRESILKGAEALRPFLNKELKGKGLKYDVTLSNPKEFNELKLRLEDEYSKHKNIAAKAKEQACGVLALAVVIVVIAAVAFYVVVISEFAFGVITKYDRDLLSEELSRSIAIELKY